MEQLLSELKNNLGEVVLTIGAFGTAAFGLVDATKATWGGVSNAGFGHILRALRFYDPALRAAVGDDWQGMLRAHWLNGRPKDEQKGIARALVRLGLSADNARIVAEAARVDGEAFAATAAKIHRGEDLDQKDLNLLGRFDAVFESQMDAAFERAEQQYRSAAKGVAALVAIGLAVVAFLVTRTGPADLDDPWFVRDLSLAILVGVIAVPLAPVAKDLSSALSAAVGALRGRPPS